MNPEQVAEKLNDEMPLEMLDTKGMNERAKKPLLSADVLNLWHSVVQNILAKSKKVESPVPDLSPYSDEQYVKFALDNTGRLSLGKGHGRKKVRLKPHQAAQNRLAGALFGNYLSSIFRKNQAEAAAAEPDAEGKKPEMKGLTQEDWHKAQRYATIKAEQLTKEPKKLASRAARRRQQTSRRINAGVIAGNHDRRSHAAA